MVRVFTEIYWYVFVLQARTKNGNMTYRGIKGMNELVKYNNVLNLVKFENFKALDYDVLMCLCHKLKNQGDTTKTFTYDELKKLINFDEQSTTAFDTVLHRVLDNQLNLKVKYNDDDVAAGFVLFPSFIIDKKSKLLSISVNKDLVFVLNELSSNFTEFELREFASLDGKYTKSLYRYLKQFKTTGWWKVSVEDFRNMLNIPEKHTNKRVMEEIIKPSLSKLNDKFDDLKCNPIKAKKRGAPVEAYEFTFKPEEPLKKDEKTPISVPIEKAKTRISKKHGIEEHEYDFAALERALLAK